MVNFEDGELVKGAYVVIDGKEYEVHMPQYSGRTPLSSENLNKMQVEILKTMLPVGSRYVTQDNTNPNEILGFGTWARLKGKVCLGLDEDDTDFNTIGKTGGSKYLQEHSHTGVTGLGQTDFMRAVEATGSNNASNHVVSNGSGGYKDHVSGSSDFPGANHYHSFTTDKTGKGNSENLQPYEVVGYMWIRRA